MDLPTCPSCGQSVLDDDAADCPFCGAAMDGSAPAKQGEAGQSKPQPKKRQVPADESAENDDPFAIKQTPSGKKIIPCARKPVKGRLHRVVCPMCDTQGFIPKRAVGMQVKCANPECLVPVFSASADGDSESPRVPTRVSDGELDQPSSSAGAGTEKKNSMLIYGIVGGVLLAATLGLVTYLNQTGDTSLPPPDNLPVFTGDNVDPDPEPGDVKPPVVDDEPEYVQKAEAFTKAITKLALVNHGNRDKAFCRRMAADAYLRLGMQEEADAEFKQMGVVSAQARRDTYYYRVGPLVARYWRAVSADEQAVAEESLATAKALIDDIPDKGGIALESGISLAAALIHSGDTSAAVGLLDRQKGDPTVASEQDSIRFSAWSAATDALRDQGRAGLYFEQVSSWRDPLFTAVGVELATQQQWQAAIDWAVSHENAAACSDTLAAVAGVVTENDPQAQDQLVAAAAGKSKPTAVRVYCVLSRVNAVWFQTAAAMVARIPLAEPQGLGKLEEMIDPESPDLDEVTLVGEALTDFVIAAAAAGSDIAVNDGFDRLYRTMASVVAPTPMLRLAAAEVGTDGRRLKRELGAELGLRDEAKIRTAFLAYRSGVTRLARVAEERRRRLIYMLARAAQAGAADAVQDAIAKPDSDLRREVMVDGLCGIIFTGAAASGHDLTALIAPDPGLAVPIARVEPVAEMAIVEDLVKSWQTFREKGLAATVEGLEGMLQMAGLRGATAITMAALTSRTSAPIAGQMKAVRRLRNERWQERSLQIIATDAVQQDRLGEAETAAEDGAATTTGRVMFLHSLVCAVLRQAENETQGESE